MGVAKPTGGYAEQMLDPGGWPDVDEQAFYDRAQQYTQVLRQVNDVLGTCQYQQTEVFSGGVWSGGAAGAANGELGTLIGEMTTMENGLATVITWHKHIALMIGQAKSDITDNVVTAHRTIEELQKDANLDEAERTKEINTVVSTTHAANVSIVDGAADWITASKAWKPPANALQDLLDQKTPPPVVIPDGSTVQPSPEPRPRPVQPVQPVQPVPVTPGTGGPKPAPVTPPADAGGPRPTPTPGTPATPAQPVAPTAPHPAPASPTVPGGAPAAPLAPATPAESLSPAAGARQPGAGGGSKGVTPAAATAGVSPASAKPVEESPAGAQAGAAGVPAGAMGSGGAGAGSGARSGAPVGQKPADKEPSTRPAASTKVAGRKAPVQPQHVAHTEVEQGVVLTPAPVIPVSAARARRDAVADASTAEAARRAGPDPLQLARRIGAALNAPGLGGGMDLGFFWVTGVTTDGAIVVANSYGLAYIPEGVQLPDKVHMASGDESIPVIDRARWATYPVVALGGWADHHDKKLRAVIGTKEQLANSDAGVATIVLQPDDIPDSGDMTGRGRLEVVDSEAAELLATTTDARLADLLPPAPAGAEPATDQQPAPAEVVDPEAAAVLISPGAGTVGMGRLLEQMPLPPAGDSPADDRLILWFEVMKPLASNATGRQVPHLRAFQTYAACAEEVVLREAHAAAEPAAQRSALADWMYWKHLTGLLNAALADPQILSRA